MTATSGCERATLVTERFPFAVECARPVLDRMAEPAGALFGRKTESAVCVLEARPFPFPYDASGSYPLSGGEEARLEDLLRSCEWDARLRGMIPVGWYARRPGGMLSPGDEVLFDRFFPEPWQIAILNMRKGAACSFHGLDGTLHAAPLRLPARGRAGWVSLALFAAAALVLAALLLLARQPLPKPRPEGAGIGLSVSDRAGQLLIRWNCDTPAIADATGAEVEVDDGGIVRRIRLGPSLLRTGSLFYSRWSENASVRMVLERRGGPPLEERARFSGPPPEPERAALIPLPEPDAAPAKPPAPKRRQPRRLAVRADRTQGPALAVLPRTPAPLPLEQRPLAVPAGAR